jgi:hypothetical protein
MPALIVARLKNGFSFAIPGATIACGLNVRNCAL